MENKQPKHRKIVPDLNNIKILMAENDELVFLIGQKILSNLNARVVNAEDGQMAVDLVRNGDFDIVLMDVHMPVMDGMTATKEIRKFNPTIPIIVVTSDKSNEIRSDFSGLSISDIVYQPYDPEYLYTVIWNTIQKTPGLKNKLQ